jgi:S1-C subfamily serine protease
VPKDYAEATRNWQPKTAPEEASSNRSLNVGASPQLAATGTGFFVTREGNIVTNYHVIDGCVALKLPSGLLLNVISHGDGNDLALLASGQPVPQFLKFSANPGRVGQSVMALGYPLRGLLSSGVNVTTGNISALAGPHDDTGVLQITAPVQPGNSGGPLLDQSGNAIGVVVAKLDAAFCEAKGFRACSVTAFSAFM